MGLHLSCFINKCASGYRGACLWRWWKEIIREDKSNRNTKNRSTCNAKSSKTEIEEDTRLNSNEREKWMWLKMARWDENLFTINNNKSYPILSGINYIDYMISLYSTNNQLLDKQFTKGPLNNFLKCCPWSSLLFSPDLKTIRSTCSITFSFTIIAIKVWIKKQTKKKIGGNCWEREWDQVAIGRANIGYQKPMVCSPTMSFHLLHIYPYTRGLSF